MMEINEVVKLIKSANHIALFSHVNPDCDTIGSALALTLFLKKKGKDVDLFCDGELKFDMLELPAASLVNARTPDSSYDLAVAVDCAADNRIGKYYAVFSRAPKTLCIDHHMQDRTFAKYNFVDPSSGATAELVWLILSAWDRSLVDREIASLLYTALVTDTGNFSFSNTGSRTLRIASELLPFGVDQAAISYKHFKEIGFDTFKLKARALAKAQFFEDNKIGILSFLSEDFKATGTSSVHSANLVNDIVNIAGVEVAVSITEVKPHSYKISIRTHKDVDANAIAMTFGGGGHKNAAGCMMNGFYGNVLDDLLKACKDHL